MATDSDCIFCRIITGQSPAKLVYQDRDVTAFWTNNPTAPIHILIVPNKHIGSVNHINDDDACLLGKLIVVSKQIAKQQNLDKSGYRLVINTGPDAGQSVYHLHLHLIGGQRMGFGPR